MSALHLAFFILNLESFISRLNVIPCHDLTLSVGEPDNAAAQTGAGTAFGVNGDPHYMSRAPLLIFCVLTIWKHLLKMRFESSCRGQAVQTYIHLLVLRCKRLLGNAPSPFNLHFPMQAAHPFGTLFTR